MFKLVRVRTLALGAVLAGGLASTPLIAAAPAVVHADCGTACISVGRDVTITAGNYSGVVVPCNDGSGPNCLDVPIHCTATASGAVAAATVLTECQIRNSTDTAGLAANHSGATSLNEETIESVDQIHLQDFEVCASGYALWTDGTQTPIKHVCAHPLLPLLPSFAEA